MPADNHFRHQPYTADLPATAPAYLAPRDQPAVDSPEWRQRMADVGQALAQQRVRQVALLHGTFVGDDPLGWHSGMGQVWPGLGNWLRAAAAGMAPRLMGEWSCFTSGYAETLARGLAAGGAAVETWRPVWNSQNHHLGRCQAALMLLEQLAYRPWEKEERLLICGHSHGGNVLAILSNLLGGDDQQRRQFVAAASQARRSAVERVRWERALQWLEVCDAAGVARRLDLVTFGTPVRYGWETRGYARLTHFVHHRPAPERPAHLARPYPVPPGDVLRARWGDEMQQWGVAGSDMPLATMARGDREANRQLAELLEAGLAADTWTGRMRIGQRCSADGQTLLVDYNQWRPELASPIVGHVVYLRSEWMLFHWETLAQRWYG